MVSTANKLLVGILLVACYATWVMLQDSEELGAGRYAKTPSHDSVRLTLFCSLLEHYSDDPVLEEQRQKQVAEAARKAAGAAPPQVAEASGIKPVSAVLAILSHCVLLCSASLV